MAFSSMAEIRRHNRATGHYFFEEGTMRFFRSKIVSRQPIAGRFFITSEQFDADAPRLYTVRRANDDGSIDTIGEFQQYETYQEARAAARASARQETAR